MEQAVPPKYCKTPGQVDGTQVVLLRQLLHAQLQGAHEERHVSAEGVEGIFGRERMLLLDEDIFSATAVT